MKITVNVLDAASIQKALKDLNQYKLQIKQKEELLVRKLAEIGLHVASVKFAGASYDGVNDVTCSIDQTGSVAVLYAKGEAVAFIEFGTGVSHPNHPSDLFAHGTYGQGKGRQPHWAYYGSPGTSGRVIRSGDKGDLVLTTGNDPAMAMWDANQEMISRISEVAREVFNS